MSKEDFEKSTLFQGELHALAEGAGIACAVEVISRPSDRVKYADKLMYHKKRGAKEYVVIDYGEQEDGEFVDPRVSIAVEDESSDTRYSSFEYRGTELMVKSWIFDSLAADDLLDLPQPNWTFRPYGGIKAFYRLRDRRLRE